ncbi:flagellar hook-associated protein FlgK [Paludibacterium paludis]|uniref:Flagellar hook-associated protein 1 n=1 Tax=Paludibacterium paludis TaxID=1225769 RepID=A0A918NXG3_9NEIS|nr:flagellar hook-associated protein FlgK [Paludibacterium paludis]GGY04832.1 flagellar hook-associated protein 1 [Paludibacterium paludis]
MSIISNALSGAVAAQAGLSATSQNISNQLTEGYSRQSVVLNAVSPMAAAGLNAGSGVEVTSIRRMTDTYKTLQLWQSSTLKGGFDSQQPYMTQLEKVMGDEGSSLAGGIDNFFKAVNAVTTEVTSQPLRQQVIDQAQALGQRFNYQARVMGQQRNTVQEQRRVSVAQVNTLTGNIAELNKQIALAAARGGSPSGLLDERDRKVDQLASLVDIQVIGDIGATVNITLKNGQPLVLNTTSSTLTVASQVDGSQALTVEFANETFKLDSKQIGGQLGGLSIYENDVLLPTLSTIQTMASDLASRVNATLGGGYDLDGNPGKPLFVYDPSNPKGMLTANPSITFRQLGFSSDASKPADSGKLLELVGLKEQPVAALGMTSVADAYAQLIGRVGLQSSQNKSSLATSTTVRAQSESDWKTTSGVNRDEEAINLVQYQQMYLSNMKVVSVAGQLFESTLSMMN